MALRFPGYEKAGDSLTLTFESAVKTLRQMDFATYLDVPWSPVTLRVSLQSLPDGTNCPGDVRITNSNYYQKLAR